MLMVLYRPPPQFFNRVQPVLYPFGFTHAAFPRDLFDEVVDELLTHGRIAGRVGSGCVAPHTFVCLFIAGTIDPFV